MGTDADELLTK